MADDRQDKSSESALNARRAALAEKLAQKRPPAADGIAGAGQPDKSQSSPSALAMGFRLSADFLSAVLVGGVLGLLLDKFAGISPWGLLVFLLLGFAAGIMNILRALGRSPPYEKRKQARRP